MGNSFGQGIRERGDTYCSAELRRPGFRGLGRAAPRSSRLGVKAALGSSRRLCGADSAQAMFTGTSSGAQDS
ncbi:MAG TPA: hypothetical protein VHN80_28035, partial [Kineosporiaceae bacterium]|nr:hypothetical protein [Kineosporiaceae bacterium]